MKVSLLYIGRPRDRAANELAQEYARRIGRYCSFQMQQVRDEQALTKHENAYKILLDPAGRHMNSRDLAALVEKAEATAVREMVFLVGGADGLSEPARRNADLLLAISNLTLPHELARVILAEQIYRVFTMLRGHPYAR